jgi:hypothetical protein
LDGGNVISVSAQAGSSTRQLDVFVSFASGDRDALVPFIHELRCRGLNVWWSDDLREGRWDIQIREKIASARRVLGIITPNAEAAERDYILTELEIARNSDKLIPLIIGGRAHSFAFRGVITLLHSYFFDNLADITASPDFEKLVTLCGGERPLQQKAEPKVSSAADRLENWFAGVESRYSLPNQIHAFSLALAAAIFENGPFTEIENLGQKLAHTITEAECDETIVPDPHYPRRTRQILALLECETIETPHPVLGVKQTLVRFHDPERSESLIQFAWCEFGRRRAILSDWWRVIADHASPEAQMRLGFALGALAQFSFIDVFEQLLKGWLLSESRSCNSVADIALSVAAFDPAAASAIRRIIESWSETGSQSELAAAVRLACGFAGTRIPGLAIETLRRATRRKGNIQAELLETMRNALANLMQAHENNADNSLFDLRGLITKLAEWVTEEASASDSKGGGIRDNPFPLMLFLLAVDGLPLRQAEKVQGRLSLDALLKDQETARLTAVIFNAALTRHRIGSVRSRELAQSILNRWIERRRKGGPRKDIQQDPLFRLAHFLVETAASPDDAERITYMFDSLYPPESLRDPLTVDHH